MDLARIAALSLEQTLKAAHVLSDAERRHMPSSAFAVHHQTESQQPGKGAYPVPDRAHARAALGLVGMHGTPTEKAQVRAKVEAKFPGMLHAHAKAALEATVGSMDQPTAMAPEHEGFGGTMGQLGSWFQRPENLAQVIGHPALQPLMHPLLHAGGAPLLFGAADLAGHGGQNLHTLMQGPVATG